MKTRVRLSLIAALAAWGLAPLAAQAQGKYPERPVRLLVPFTAGSSADITARRFSARASPLFGQQFVPENRAGAAGNIAAVEVARAKPDGYTLLISGSSTHVITPLVNGNKAYDPMKDFTHIVILGLSNLVIAVHPSVARTLPELIKLAKAKPGALSFGSNGIGGIQHLAGELFKKQAGGLDIVHVPYKGGAQSLPDVISGQIPMFTPGFASALPSHRSGKVRILAVLAGNRQSVAPEIPTATEAGAPGVVANSFYGISAPADTPKSVIDQFYQVANRVLSDEAFQKETIDSGLEPHAKTSPERATQFIRDDITRWAPIVKALNLKE